MTKTTIYLEENWLSDLRRLSHVRGRAGIATLIRQAVAEFLSREKSRKSRPYLAGIIAGKAHLKSSFGPDPVLYQRRLRAEWDR